MKVTDLLFKSGKHIELEDKLTKMRKKFKQEPEMWVHIAKIYYLMGNFKEARNVKNLCLKSISIKKERKFQKSLFIISLCDEIWFQINFFFSEYNLILKFAILEFAHGEVENGIIIFESVLVSYPNKVGAWLVYIDQLISKKLFKDAR